MFSLSRCQQTLWLFVFAWTATIDTVTSKGPSQSHDPIHDNDDEDPDLIWSPDPSYYTSLNYEDHLKYTQCVDLRESCAEWAAEGKCETNLPYMGPHCPQSCRTCHILQTRQVPLNQAFSKAPIRYLGPHGWDFPSVMGIDLGEPQVVAMHGSGRTTSSDAMQERIQQARDYVQTIEEKHQQSCRNRHENCATWAIQGQCEANPAYMLQQCGPVCFSCHSVQL